MFGLQVYILDRIRDLSAESSQTLEALADGVNVGHTHKHHLTVGIVLYKKHTIEEPMKGNCILKLVFTDLKYAHLYSILINSKALPDNTQIITAAQGWITDRANGASAQGTLTTRGGFKVARLV